MECFPLVPLISIPPPLVISPLSSYAAGMEAAAMNAAAPASATLPAPPRAYLHSFSIPFIFTARALFVVNGAVAAGNFDIGIYDANFSLLRSTGSTAQVGTALKQTVAITALKLQPGQYWLALAGDDVSAQYVQVQLPSTGASAIYRPLQLLATFPLPLSGTGGIEGNSRLVLFGAESVTP